MVVMRDDVTEDGLITAMHATMNLKPERHELREPPA
jgi:hypothetical protein